MRIRKGFCQFIRFKPSFAMQRKLSDTQPARCLPAHVKATYFKDRVAIHDAHGSYSYNSLLSQSELLSDQVKRVCTPKSLFGERVAYLTDNDASSVLMMWSTWMNGAIAVPLCKSHPIAEKQYFVDDSAAALVVGTEQYADDVVELARRCNIPSLIVPKCSAEFTSDTSYEALSTSAVPSSQRALIIYTSGTTGRPKGVVLTHGNLIASMQSMIDAWGWRDDDVCLHTLPLHHVHGLINALMTPLYVGAQCIMLQHFTPQQAWSKLLYSTPKVTVFHAVPTIYAKMLSYYKESQEKAVAACSVKDECRKVRLMVSGSAALPRPLMEEWRVLTGHALLERYGMTETLMVLTNPLTGDRRSGTVGQPFPGVEVILAKVDGSAPNGYVDVTFTQLPDNPDRSEDGELYVRGPSVFSEYWGRPEATADSFTTAGWFKTGDTVCLEDGYFRIMGRTSVDIIKSGGYKISALDIESKLLQHEHIAECVVLGKPDPVWGQTVAAVVVTKPGCSLTLESLKAWCSERMPKYHIPVTLIVMEQGISKNAMGKVNKKALAQQLFAST